MTSNEEWSRYIAIAIIKSLDAKEDKRGNRLPPGEAIDMTERILSEYTIEPKRPQCFGCECEVPLVNGMHHEETDMPGVDYVYPCTGEAPDLRVREMPKGV